MGALVLAVVLVLAVAVVPADAANAPSGQGVTPSVVSLGGQSGDCAAVGSTAAHEFRVVNPQNGTYTDPATQATFTLTVSAGQVFVDFTSTGAFVADIVIKGGTKSTHYDYFAAGIGSVTSDTGLHAPAKGSTYFGISHIAFCYGAGGGLTLGCGGFVSNATYAVQLGSGANCTKIGDNEYVFETWAEGGNQYAKFVPAGEPGSGTALVVERLTWSFTGQSQNSTTIRYDDDASNGLNYVPMPFCNYDPRNGELTLVEPTDASAVLPGDATSCLIESTESVPDTAGEPNSRVDYVFSTVDGYRLTP